MIKNKWFNEFIESFAGSVDKKITEKQANIFMKYAEFTKISRYTTEWTGTAINYKFVCQEYKKGSYTLYSLYVKKNNDAEIERLQAECRRLDEILDTDISDAEYDHIEEHQIKIQKRIAELENDYSR